MKPTIKLGLALLVLGASAAFAQEPEPENPEETAVRETGEAYVKAFNAGDAKALAAFWSPEAVYTNRLTGEQVVGREKIAEQFSGIFQAGDQKLKLEIDVSSIQFVSPNVAVEHGRATFLAAKGEPDEVDYSAVYLRREGKWLLDRVTDDPKPLIKSNYEHLKSLEWLVGSWLDEDENARIVTECNWTKNKNFLTRTFTVAIGDQIDMSGMQIIGWDAAAKQVRSWTFDSTGGFAEGVWSNKENRWYVRKKGSTAEGQKATAVNVINRVDEDTFTLQSIQRTLAGKLLPNVNEVMVVRQ